MQHQPKTLDFGVDGEMEFHLDGPESKKVSKRPAAATAHVAAQPVIDHPVQVSLDSLSASEAFLSSRTFAWSASAS